MSNSKKVEVPKGWSIVKQGNISRFINGRAYKQSEFRESGTPVVRIQNLTGSLNYVYSDLQLPADKYINEGDLIYAWSATFGPYIWRGTRAIYHYHIWKIECDESKVNKQFYYYRLGFISNETSNKKNGSVFAHLTKSFMENHEINLPPLNEQQKIATILSSVDGAIDKTEAIIEQTEKVKKGLMQQLLTKGIGHTKFMKTDVGKIPEEWEALSFNDVLGFVGSGITPKGGSAVYQLDGIPFIRSQNVYPDGLRLDDIACISDTIHEKMNRSKVQEHDVLLNITGASIGRCTYVPTGFGEANVNQHVCILRSNGKVYHKYLAYFINSSLGQRQIFSEQAGQTREGLNYQQIRAFSIYVPTMAEQEKIANIIDSFDQKANNERKKLNTLQYLKKGLMQTLLRGKVRVTVGEAKVTQI